MTRDNINRSWTTIWLQHTGYKRRIDKGARSLLDGNYVPLLVTQSKRSARQDRFRNLYAFQTNSTMYHLSELENFRLNPLSRDRRHTSSGMKRQLGDHFSIGYPTMCPTRHWRQKYSIANQGLTRILGLWSLWRTCIKLLRRGYGVPGEGSRYPKQGATPLYVFEPCSTQKILWGSKIFCEQENRGGLCNPKSWHQTKRVLWMKPLHQSWRENIRTKKNRFTLDVYDIMPNFIPMDITEDVVKLVVRKLSWISGPGGTDPETLQGWLLKFEEDSKKTSY